MNKGIRRAQGDYCLFLNSGDWLIDDKTLARVFEEIANTDDAGIYYTDAKLYPAPPPPHPGWLYQPQKMDINYLIICSLCHQNALIKRSLFFEHGLYSEKFKIAADYEFWLKEYYIHKTKFIYITTNISNYDFTGISSTNVSASIAEAEDAIRNVFGDLSVSLIKMRRWYDGSIYSSIVETYGSSKLLDFILKSYRYIIKRITKFLKKKQKKINMLYDAGVIAGGCIDKALRTGIFFAAYNVLKQLMEDHRFNITLYVYDNINGAQQFCYDSLLSQLPLCINTEEAFKFSIKEEKHYLQTSDTILKKMIPILKIIKKYFIRLFLRRNHNCLLRKIDVYFSPFHTAPPEIIDYQRIRHFMILHDITPVKFPEYFPDMNPDNIYFDDICFNKITRSLNKKTYYFCNSGCTRRDFLNYYGGQLDENKMIVIYHASSQNFSHDCNRIKLTETLKKYKIQHKADDNYIFSFCTLEPRKNLLFTVRCFVKFIQKHSIQNLYFYLGGPQWDSFIHLLEEQITGLDEYRDKIVRLGYVDDKDVNILYSNSLFFTYISQYEGFGIPPLEAMQAGTPVITSNNSSLPEVVGDAAIMVDYDSEEQCIKAFEDLYFNKDLRKHYIEKGLERAKLFSWEKAVKKMTDIIIRELE